MANNKEKRINVRIDEETKKNLDHLVQSKGVTISGLICELLKKEFKKINK